MLVKNIFRINDWEISRFFMVILSLAAGLLGLELLDALGCHIPLAKPIAGFIFLTFIPGMLLLRIFRIHKVSGVEAIVYAAGLSLFFDMITGLLMNVLYPCIGVRNPLTEYYIVVTMLFGTAGLSLLCYFRDRDYQDSDVYMAIDRETIAPLLFLLLLPPLSILGAYAVNVYATNLLLYVLIFAIATVVILCGFNKFIPERLYPLAIFVAALSLEFHNAFMSGYLWSWDVHVEYNVASQVIASGYWDQSVAYYLNAMLSIVILAPVYFNVCGMDLTSVFKVAFQLIFCLVPLGLYVIFKKQTDGRIACLACLLFVAVVTFFTEMQGLTRQEIAELFLVLIVMLMIDADLDKQIRSALMVIFGIGLILSHYGLSYIYILVFSLSVALFIAIKSAARLLKIAPGGYPVEKGKRLPVNHTMTLTFIGVFICFLFFWYMYTSQSTTLGSISYLLYKMLTSISTEFLNPDHVQGLSYIVQGSSSPLYELKKYMQLAFQGFIVIGFLLVALQSLAIFAFKRVYRFSAEYVILAFVNLLICLSGITLPYFASSLNTSRLYQITLIILAPMCIIGGVGLITAVLSPLKMLRVNAGGHAMKVMSVIVVIYLLFNTGLVFNIMNDHPMSVALSRSQINNYSLNERAGLYDALNTFEADYYATGWLSNDKAADHLVYTDYISHYPMYSYGNTPLKYQAPLYVNESGEKKNSYIYLGYANIKGNVLKEASGTKAVFSTDQILPRLDNYDAIYASDGAVIYYVPG